VTVVRRSRRVHRRYGTADAIADTLRDRLLSGDIPDGSVLPKQDDLADQFGVSKAAIREACRILETEGLLRVVRGNVGGSIVNVPTPKTAAYTVGMVLQARDVKMSEVGFAVQRLEPLAVELCAERPDRAEAVLPALESSQADLARCIDSSDGDGASVAARRWHELLVESCGSDTITVLLGALEAVWSSQARGASIAAGEQGLELDLTNSRRAFQEHEQIQALIRAGDAAAAAVAARKHLETARIYPERSTAMEATVRCRVIRDLLV
jgi:GntR family transcriptional regulator, transcriptional repressor for pyruvate dehydrogenase complex